MIKADVEVTKLALFKPEKEGARVLMISSDLGLPEGAQAVVRITKEAMNTIRHNLYKLDIFDIGFVIKVIGLLHIIDLSSGFNKP